MNPTQKTAIVARLHEIAESKDATVDFVYVYVSRYEKYAGEIHGFATTICSFYPETGTFSALVESYDYHDGQWLVNGQMSISESVARTALDIIAKTRDALQSTLANVEGARNV